MVTRSLLLLGLFFTISACSADRTSMKVIAQIPEASGICYDATTDLLYVVGDEGMLYALTTDGAIKRRKKLGDYDFEGVACDTRRGRLILAIEGDDDLLIVDRTDFTPLKRISIKRRFQKREILAKGGNGLEGITLAPDGTLYLTNQSEHKYPHADPSVIVTLPYPHAKKGKITGIIDIQKIDLAGLDWHRGSLYIVSDKKDRLYRYNPTSGRIDLKRKLPKFAQEGVAFDTKGDLYFADDDGRVLKSTKKALSIP